MSARRLNESEKQEIIALYRQTGETSISLAERFGVSNSTIGRVLKNGIDTEEYDALVQQKRGRGSADSSDKPASKRKSAAKKSASKKRSRARNKAAREVDEIEAVVEEVLVEEVSVGSAESDDESDVTDIEQEDLEQEDVADDDYEDENEPADPEYLEVAAELGSTDAEDEDDAFDADDFDEDFDEEDAEEDADGPALQLEARDQLIILPLSDANVPKVFYLVVDRGADLIAPPLRDFGELGEMSSEEAENRTLPMFDNHRVAKRFSNVRTQRVIKVPDNRLFYKTTQHLTAKGIKRFLLDGQVYTLT